MPWYQDLVDTDIYYKEASPNPEEIVSITQLNTDIDVLDSILADNQIDNEYVINAIYNIEIKTKTLRQLLSDEKAKLISLRQEILS